MDSQKCLWCEKDWVIYRDYTKCCSKLYHWGCRIHHTWTRPSWEVFCPLCGVLNFGEHVIEPKPELKTLWEEIKKR